MAEVIDKHLIVYHIGRLMKEATEYVYIVCPFIKMRNFLSLELDSELVANKLAVNIIFGKKVMDYDTYRFFYSRSNVNIYFCKELHSKIYMNDKFGIICSMNIHDYSILNNIETGVYFERGENLFFECYRKVKYIREHSEIYKQRVRVIQ